VQEALRQHPPAMRDRASWIVAAVLLLGVGCTCADEVEVASPSALASAADLVEVSNGHVRLAVRDALQLAVLERLADQAGFDLEVSGATPRRVTLDLAGVSLAEAIAALLAQERYSLEYAVDPGTGSHTLAVLRVGEKPSPPRVASAPPQQPARLALGASPRPRASEVAEPPSSEPDEGRRTRSDRIDFHRERMQRMRDELKREPEGSALEERLRGDLARERVGLQEELRVAIDDPDPAVRADAVADLDLEGAGNRDRVADMSRSDADPAVRAATAEALADDGTFAAINGLLGMLEDPNPGVLAAAIAGLDYAGDETLASHVAPFATHPDPAVREAATEALEYWE
jgi:hypothetical protein